MTKQYNHTTRSPRILPVGFLQSLELKQQQQQNSVRAACEMRQQMRYPRAPPRYSTM